MKEPLCIFALASCLCLAACGGSTPATVTLPPLLSYTIGGTVSGLSGTGLVLQNNGSDNLAINANGAFAFTTLIASGATYAVTVLTQPSTPAQICAVTNGTAAATANITNVQVTCTNSYTIGGKVSGLSGTGLVLQDNGADNLPVAANGAFTFATPIASGGAFAVSVLTQPSAPPQVCAITNGNGTVTANITNVQVTCTTSYTIGGTVSGLLGTGLVLQNNAGDNLAITANGAFNFLTPVGGGQAYSVTVLAAPSNPSQNCTVANGSGTANANVSNVQVACTNTVTTNQWEWVDGSDVSGQPGTYGTLGTAAPGNIPSSRDSGVTWTDSTGNLWLFGGFGEDSTGEPGVLNDLWKYDAGQWTWMSGSNLVGEPGVYGTQGIAAPADVPGSRKGSVRWTDANGNFWLFGGLNPGAGNAGGEYNDLWEYAAGQWTWVSGANVPGEQGTYGTQGLAASSNVPGGRVSAVSWIDAAGSFWLFGGDGVDSVDNFGVMNDLWKYSAGNWTWMNGAKTEGQPGTYGTQGAGSAANVPGARRLAVSWTDAAGTFWLFGGEGYDSTGAYGELNDLWSYTAGEWTWVNGSNLRNQFPTYGTQGVSAPGNVPGSRDSALSLVDSAGNLWLFGGEGYDSNHLYGQLNDLWKYSAGQWTWVNGSNLISQPPTYGTEGTPAPGNVPGARIGPMGWSDASGNLWVFGGAGLAAGTSGELNDLWRDIP
jgi:hypothetical protein